MISKVFQISHEDIVLELRGIHVAAEDVGGFPQEGFELLEGDLVCHVRRLGSLSIVAIVIVNVFVQLEFGVNADDQNGVVRTRPILDLLVCLSQDWF